MTTAERRRRRRRGGGLRVPSDNVPRRTNPPVVAPVPEDPSLAMSIAYSFTSEASEPVPRVTVETPVPKFADPVAPEMTQTVIDPPSSQVESADFEMKTREMSAVDLQALGLEEPNGSSGSSGRYKRAERPEEVEVDMVGLDGNTLDEDPDEEATAMTAPSVRRERVKTVALSDDDLEEVRESMRKDTAVAPSQTRAQTQPSAPPPAATRPATASSSVEVQSDQRPAAESMWPTEPAVKPMAGPTPKKPIENTTAPTQALSASDIELLRPESDDPLSVPEIDINELADRAESSGEFEVDVDEDDEPKTRGSSIQEKLAAANAPVAPAAAGTNPSVPRTRSSSAPPPMAPAAAQTNPGVPPPPSKDAHAHHASPPPPPPAAIHHHKAPPAPPPKPEKKAGAPASKETHAKLDQKAPKGKPWFVDLFDEDYLRTLPFLTPQATQHEAEFVIDAMGLSPGAQVLDVGCGYGRHAMELAARGFHVVGLDLSTPLLVRGGEEAHRRGLQINFVRGDMRELDFEAQFDGAYCLFSTFGYFDDETNKKTVANIARALKPGGRLMIEILNRDYVIADLPTRVWWEGEGCVVLEEVELNYFSSRIAVNRSVVFDDGRQLEQEISVRAYSLHEVGKLMHAAGFRVLEVSGGYHTRGRFFGNQSRHIIVLAERKESSGS
ncbi:MAG: methyltransferase domain-containing protein [Deltaproteobacteria bacterium]|nr:methyltransferase domain-containing protein [Deltaproteobacteria bacterium]